MQLDRPVVFDVSNIDDSETNLQAAVLLACWSYGFGAVAVYGPPSATSSCARLPAVWRR